MDELVNIGNHPSNLDKTARIVWEDRSTYDTVYRVKAGFVATIGGTGKAFHGHFPTQEAAVMYLNNRRYVKA